MRTLLTLILFITISLNTFSQEELAPPVELFFITEGAPSSPIITFTLTAQSQCWGDISGNSNPPGYGEYFLTDDFDEVTYVPESNNMGGLSAGYEFITSNRGLNSPYPVFAYGLYKVTSDGTNKHFYLDYRDYRIGYYSYYSPPTNGHNIDLWIKYRYDQDVFYYSSTGSANDFHSIESGQLLNLWDIKQKGTQLTDQFPDYWENALAAIPQKNPSTGVFEPFLVWGPNNQISSPFVYQIYWRYGETGSFDLLKTVDANTTTTRHENLAAVGGGRQAYYKVRAYNNQGPDYSDFTNIANIGVGQFYGGYDKKNLYENISNNEYKLMQNYPNPFNPGTIINYTVAANSLVTIKVYDILGNEVIELVNSNKAPGNYSVTFDASGLSSGLYFYQLKAGGYSITKKMLVAK